MTLCRWFYLLKIRRSYGILARGVLRTQACTSRPLEHPRSRHQDRAMTRRPIQTSAQSIIHRLVESVDPISEIELVHSKERAQAHLE